MRLELTGRHVEITAALRRLVDKKLARLERVLNDAALSAQVVLTREKRERRADVTLHARGEKFLHGVGGAANWETSLSQAIDKITQQAKKVKGKWAERRRRGIGKAAVAAAELAAVAAPAPARPPRREQVRMPRIIRASRQPLQQMSVADAARQVDSNGEGAVIFRDAETAAISVLFRHISGELMLVEAEP